MRRKVLWRRVCQILQWQADPETQGLDRIEDVEKKMKGGRLLIERKDAVTLKQGEYFIGPYWLRHILKMKKTRDPGAES